MLRIKNLNIGYRHALLHEPFSLEVKKPSLIALVGDNGAGKTTFLRTLAGLQPPLQGKVFVNNQDVHQATPLERSRLVSISLAHLPQRLGMTVEQILELTVKLTHARVKNPEFNFICDFLQIRTLFHRPFANLSDGQKQKVMIARAFIQNTPVILLDEPYSHLDSQNRRLLTRLLDTLKKDKLIVFATHDQLSILNVDMIWHIDKHRIIPQTINNFLTNSHQIRQFYNFYHTRVVKTGKQD